MEQLLFVGDAEYVCEASARSFQRLGLDSIDLCYVHRTDKAVPIEAFRELVEVGKIKLIDLSECSSNTLRQAYAVHPIAVDKLNIHLLI